MKTTYDQLLSNCQNIVSELNDLTEETASEYLHDALDINFTIDSRGNFLGSEILVAFGGPTISISTSSMVVEGHWGSDKIRLYYDDSGAIFEASENLYEAVR